MNKQVKKVFRLILLLGIVLSVTSGGNIKAEVLDSGFEVRSLDSDLVIGCPIYARADNGATITALTTTPNIKVTVKVGRVTEGIKYATAITALYDGSNNLVNTWSGSCTLDGAGRSETKDIVTNISLPAVTASHYVKTFLWKDLNTMKPYSNLFKFPGTSTIVTAWNNITGPWSISNEDSYSGFCSLKANYNGSTTAVYQDISVQPNKMYRMSFCGKGWQNITYKVTDLSNNLLSIATSSGPATWYGSSGWTRAYSGVFNSGSNTMIRVALSDVSTAAGTAYIDNVAVEDITNNLLYNGDFEFGADGWAANGSGAGMSIVSTPVYEGSKTLFSNVRPSKYSGMQQQLRYTLGKSGRGTYKIEGWVRSESGSATYLVNIKTGTVINFGSVAANSTEWTKVSFTKYLDFSGTTGTDPLGEAFFYIEQDSTKSAESIVNFYIDNFSLVKISD